MEEEVDYWQITNEYVTLYKNGSEIAYGRLSFSLWNIQWYEDCEDHQRECDDNFIILDGKELIEGEDYDKIEWGEEREEMLSEDSEEVLKYFEDLKSSFIKEQKHRVDNTIKNEQGTNKVYEGDHGVYYKFNKVNGKVHGIKEMYGERGEHNIVNHPEVNRKHVGLRDTLLMLSAYENGILNGLQITYCPKEYNDWDIAEKVFKIEKFDKGKCVKVQKFTHLNILYAHLLYSDEPDIIADSEGAIYPSPYLNQKLVNFFNDLTLSIFDGSISIKKFKSEITEDEAKLKLREVVCYLYPNI